MAIPDHARGGVYGEALVVSERVWSDPVADLAVEPDIGVDSVNADHFGTHRGVLRDPHGEVWRGAQKLGGIVVEVLFK